MHRVLSIIVLSTLLSFQLSASEEVLKEVTVESVYEDGDYIVLETDAGIQKIKLKEALKNEESYNIKVHERAFIKTDKKILKRALTLAEKTKLHRLLYSAELSYQKKDFEKAWKLVEKAQRIDPWNTKLINMKGSILFVTGAKELAVEHWKYSLQIKPKQPELATLIVKYSETEEKATIEPTAVKQGKVEAKDGETKKNG